MFIHLADEAGSFSVLILGKGSESDNGIPLVSKKVQMSARHYLFERAKSISYLHLC